MIIGWRMEVLTLITVKPPIKGFHRLKDQINAGGWSPLGDFMGFPEGFVLC